MDRKKIDAQRPVAKLLLFCLFTYIFLFLNCQTKSRETLPKTLLFSPISPEYLKDTASEWKASGFDGFLLSDIMRNWADDIWATDNDSSSRGENDATYQRVKACNSQCSQAGIHDNFIKIAFYSHIPLWTDNIGWEKMFRNFGEVARFAKMSGCRGIALDIEYVSEQYDLGWEGYDYSGYTRENLERAAQLRGRQLVNTMLKNYPEMVLLTLPEGISYYGPLAADLFAGMVQGMAEAKAAGGLFLLTEHTYSMTNPLALIHFSRNLNSQILQTLDDQAQSYWKEKCGIALGGWPLGYYRKITDEAGKFLGYSGKEEKFGNKVVGSYADKSRRFTHTEFRNQYAGMLLASKGYCWIYGHGATWWQIAKEDTAKYGKMVNATLPLDNQLVQFKKILQEKWLSSPEIQRISQLAEEFSNKAYLKTMGFVKNFKVIGPFGCQNCNNFNQPFPPEAKISFSEPVSLGDSTLEWQSCTVDSNSGYLNFLEYLRPTNWVCAFAYCRVTAPRAALAQIRLGTNDSGTLWFNDKKILSKNVERSAAPDADILPVQLKKGVNTILVKVCNTERNWGLYLRLTDENGATLKNLSYWP